MWWITLFCFRELELSETAAVLGSLQKKTLAQKAEWLLPGGCSTVRDSLSSVAHTHTHTAAKVQGLFSFGLKTTSLFREEAAFTRGKRTIQTRFLEKTVTKAVRRTAARFSSVFSTDDKSQSSSRSVSL